MAFSMYKKVHHQLEKQVQAMAVVTKISYEIELRMLRFRISKSQLIPISFIFSHLNNSERPVDALAENGKLLTY